MHMGNARAAFAGLWLVVVLGCLPHWPAAEASGDPQQVIYTNLPRALEYAVRHYSTARRGFVMDIRGRRAPATGEDPVVQVVDGNSLFQDDEYGLTVYLAFGDSSEQRAALERFRDMQVSRTFADVGFDRVSAYARRLGTDVPAAVQVLGEILQGVYGYGPGTPLQMGFTDF